MGREAALITPHMKPASIGFILFTRTPLINQIRKDEYREKRQKKHKTFIYQTFQQKLFKFKAMCKYKTCRNRNRNRKRRVDKWCNEHCQFQKGKTRFSRERGDVEN
jgi:hypothetical protein